MENYQEENPEVLGKIARDEIDKINKMAEGLNQRIKDFEQKNELEFKKTLKTIKHIFKEKGLILPRDWKEIFYSWYVFEKLGDEKYDLTFDILAEKITDRTLYFEWAESYMNKLIPEKIEVKAYTNLPHVLCILDDLGILDLITEKFSDKHYKGRARETDKAKLIATILGIEDAQKIRYAIKNSDYLSDKAKNNAVETLKSLGLEPSKFID